MDEHTKKAGQVITAYEREALTLGIKDARISEDLEGERVLRILFRTGYTERLRDVFERVLGFELEVA